MTLSLALIGYRGTGKSTVGALLARRLGLAFVDTDRLVESRGGESIASIFARGGEELFRDAESAALNSLLEPPVPRVVACGGGIILRRENRAVLRKLAPGRIFLLTAPAEVIARRVAGDERSAAPRPPRRGNSGSPAEERSPLSGTGRSPDSDRRKKTGGNR